MTAKLTKISALCVFFINAVIITIPLLPSAGQYLNASSGISVVSVWKTTCIEREMVQGAESGNVRARKDFKILSGWTLLVLSCYLIFRAELENKIDRSCVPTGSPHNLFV